MLSRYGMPRNVNALPCSISHCASSASASAVNRRYSARSRSRSFADSGGDDGDKVEEVGNEEDEEEEEKAADDDAWGRTEEDDDLGGLGGEAG